MPAPPSMSEMQSARAFENSLFISPQPLSNRSFQLVYRRLNENSSVAGKNSFSLAQTAAKRGKSTGLQRVHCRRLLTDNRADLLGVHSYKELENQYLSLRLGELRERLTQVHALRRRAGVGFGDGDRLVLCGSTAEHPRRKVGHAAQGHHAMF